LSIITSFVGIDVALENRPSSLLLLVVSTIGLETRIRVEERGPLAALGESNSQRRPQINPKVW
jgi:hypothetical protein